MRPDQVTAYGADYSAREFTPAQMDGYPGVPIGWLARYIGYPGNAKCISYYPGAYRAHTAAGRPVALYHQVAYRDFEGGYDGGRAHAQIALADARSSRVGWNGESPVIACFDRRMAAFTRNGVFYPAIGAGTVRDYVRGFRSVVGDLTGFYGFEDTMALAIAEQWASFTMQCGARSAHIPGITAWQENNVQPILLGTATDRLELYKPLNEVFGMGDDMSWDTPITLSAAERRQYEPDWDGGDTTFTAAVWEKYSSFYAGLAVTGIQEVKTMLAASAAREAATLTALAAISKNPNVTKEELRVMINDAVKNNIKITGTLDISTATPPASAAARED